MAKVLLSRFSCDKCGKTAEYIETKETIKEYDQHAAYDLWHYENGLGHLCPDCSSQLKETVKRFFKK